jgi:hypothetical protein
MNANHRKLTGMAFNIAEPHLRSFAVIGFIGGLFL